MEIAKNSKLIADQRPSTDNPGKNRQVIVVQEQVLYVYTKQISLNRTNK